MSKLLPKMYDFTMYNFGPINESVCLSVCLINFNNIILFPVISDRQHAAELGGAMGASFDALSNRRGLSAAHRHHRDPALLP